MHNTEIMSVRKGDYKLFVNEPNYYKLIDLDKWSDQRAPDGVTIIAPMVGQATPEQYPGIKPEKPKNKIQLFNLKNDPTESKDLSKEKPQLVKELIKEYNDFGKSLQSTK